MNNGQENKIETLLREHLHRELDRHVGRSVERFVRDVHATPRLRLTDAPPAAAPHRRLRLFAWSGGLAGAAIAASITIVMLLNGLMTPPPNPAHQFADNTLNQTQQSDAPLVLAGDLARDLEHEVSWQTIDRGTVFLDGEIPLRSLMRQQVESLRWYDPQRQAHVELQIPRDEVMLVGYNSF